MRCLVEKEQMGGERQTGAYKKKKKKKDEHVSIFLKKRISVVTHKWNIKVE